MMSSDNPFQRIVVAANPQTAKALPEAKKIADFLSSETRQVTFALLDDQDLQQKVRAKEVDLMIALGGDGTMLRAGHLCAPVDIPILGINLGRFGFLIEIQKDQWRQTLPLLDQGDYWYECRMMLKADHWRGSERLGTWDVVNEAVVGLGRIKRPVHLDAYVDGHYLASYIADGLIVATPTGSTAYALAAGGPILPPELRNILIVPVAPHLSIDRAVVLAEGSTVSMVVKTGYEAVLSVDGQMPVDLEDGDRVEVRGSAHNMRFVRFQERAYFYGNLAAYLNRNPAARAET
jgi:NAD+ kinase